MLDDPLSLLSICVWTLAAGMYPFGLMLGSECSPCCGCKCEDGETLPSMLEVTFSDIPEDYECCATMWNGATVRVTREGESCFYSKNCCGNTVTVQYRGTSTTPIITLSGKCDIVFEAESSGVPFECARLTFDAYEPLGGKASVVDNVSILTEDGDALAGESGESLGTEISDPPCPPCCVGLPAEFNDDACTESACTDAGGSWVDPCECVGCDPENCEGLELIVDVVGTCARNTNTITRNYTATLNAANGFGQLLLDPVDPTYDFCQVYYECEGPTGGGVFVWMRIGGNFVPFNPYLCDLFTRSYGFPHLLAGPQRKCGSLGWVPLPMGNGLCPVAGASQECDQNFEYVDIANTILLFSTQNLQVTITLVT